MKKVATYALFGNHVTHGTRQFYWDHLPALVRAHHNFYPDWELRIYVDSTYHEDRSRVLRAYVKTDLVRAFYVEENVACCRSMLWRMLPVWEKDVAYVVCRDIDAMPCPKDVRAINQWIASGAAIHAINDNQQHTVVMMGGMVGFKVDSFMKKCPWPRWIDMIEAYEGLDKPSGGYDQMLMSDTIWNRYYPDICAHRFAGLGSDPALRACYTSVGNEPLDGLSEQLCLEADVLMRHLGASSYDIPKAIDLFDKYGRPEVSQRVHEAEVNAK